MSAPSVNTASPDTPRRKAPFFPFESLHWDDLTERERETVWACGVRATQRGGLCFGVALTLMGVMWLLPRRAPGGSRMAAGRLPLWLRLTATTVLSTGVGYVGAASTLPSCARQLAAMPDSTLAARVRESAEEWRVRKVPRSE